MSRRNESEEQGLDERFEDILANIKPYLLKLPVSKESRLCRAWLERLNCADDQRNLRNDYLFELYKQLKKGYLNSPFSKPPETGKLIPIAKSHRTVPTSSSCNELTETSVGGQKRSFQKPRSKSLRRDQHNRRSRIPTYSSMPLSPDRSSPVTTEPQLSPTVNFCELTENNRNARAILLKYKGRIEDLSAIIEDLETQNDKLKQKVAYYRKLSMADDIPHMRARIKQLLAEIEGLKKRLNELLEIKDMLEKSHQRIIEKYKLSMTEHFNKLKRELEKARVENHTLNNKIAAVEKQLQEYTQQKEQPDKKTSDTNLENKIQSIKVDFENRLQKKEYELKIKDELVHQKENELIQKIEEIDLLNQKLKEFQDSIDKKNQEAKQSDSLLVDQYKYLKDDLVKMHLASEKQNMEMMNMRKHMARLEKFVLKLQQEYEKKLFHIVKENEIGNLVSQFKSNLTEKGGLSNWKKVYSIFLSAIKIAAKDKRCQERQDLVFLENQIRRLKNN